MSAPPPQRRARRSRQDAAKAKSARSTEDKAKSVKSKPARRTRKDLQMAADKERASKEKEDATMAPQMDAAEEKGIESQEVAVDVHADMQNRETKEKGERKGKGRRKGKHNAEAGEELLDAHKVENESKMEDGEGIMVQENENEHVEGGNGSAETTERKRHSRRRRKCAGQQMHRQAKLGVIFALAATGFSAYSSWRADWTLVHVRRENTRIPFDSWPDTPCHAAGRQVCGRCLDSNTVPQVPRPNPDGPRDQPRDEWLPAMPGCGWCEAQGRCLEGMREHPTTDYIGTTPGDGNLPPALGVAQNPNFCGPQSRQNATGQAQKRKQIWIKDVNPEAGENAELIAPTERYEMVLGTAAIETGFDEGYMNDRKEFVPPNLGDPVPGWLQNILECNGTVMLQLGLFRTCQQVVGTTVQHCYDNNDPGGPCYALGIETGNIIDCTDFEARVKRNKLSHADQRYCIDRARNISQVNNGAVTLSKEDSDLCALKEGEERTQCKELMQNICFEDGDLAKLQQMSMEGLTFLGAVLAIICGRECIGDKSCAPPVWQLRLQIIAIGSAVLCSGAALCQYLAMRAWRKLQFALAETLEVDGCEDGVTCARYGTGFWYGAISASLSFFCALMMIFMVRKFARRVRALHALQVTDISAEIEHGGWLEKEANALEDDELDDVLRIKNEEGGLFQESADSAPPQFHVYVFKDPSGSLPTDRQIEVVFFDEGPVFKNLQPPPPAPPIPDAQRRIMSWKSWGILKSCKVVPPEVPEGHTERDSHEHNIDDELQEVVIETQRGDFFFEVEDAQAFCDAVMAVLAKIAAGVQKGSGGRIRGDAIDSFTLLDPQYVGKLPDEVSIIVNERNLHICERDTCVELAQMQHMAVTMSIERPTDPDDMDVIVLDVGGLQYDYKFECDDADVLLANFVTAKAKLQTKLTGVTPDPQGLIGTFATGASNALTKTLDAAENIVDSALDRINGGAQAMTNLMAEGANAAKSKLAGGLKTLTGGFDHAARGLKNKMGMSNDGSGSESNSDSDSDDGGDGGHRQGNVMQMNLKNRRLQV